MTSLLVLYVVVSLPAVGGRAAAVRWFGFDDADGWALGRTLGLVGVAYPAWWAGVAGVAAWHWVGAAVLVVLAVWGGIDLWRRPPDWRSMIRAEAVFLVCSATTIWLRLARPEILHQEKLMDLGIFASLLRADSFPPPDMWLAGQTLPYYYWGGVPWSVPLFLSRIPLDLSYNLVVAALVGLTGCVLWSLGRRAGGSVASGWIAVGIGLFAGTADGLRQVLGGRPFESLDVWHSSRQVVDTITEWPLFTLWLGDLHPHLLSMPLALAAVLVAWQAGKDGPRISTTLGATILIGLTWAANPWAMPPTLVAAGLMMLCGDGRWHWPHRGGWPRWIAIGVAAIGGWLAAAPFHLDFHPPFQGLALVRAWTEPVDLVLWGGVVLLPAAVACWVLMTRAVGGGLPGRAAAASLVAATLVAASVTGRPSLMLVGAMLVVLVAGAVLGEVSIVRPSVALAALGAFLLAVPEVIYVVDSYGDKLHRMNTVFKCYIQAWPLLAVAVPGLLAVPGIKRRTRLAVGLAVAAMALPHLVGLALQPFTGARVGLDGLQWMDAGDRAVVRFLRRQPSGTFIAEAVGGAYTEYARISSASGVPALLGWANHEMVWRGPDATRETDRRRDLIHRIYGSADAAEVTAAVDEAGVNLVVIGALERRDFSQEGLEAIRRAGEVVFAEGGAEVVRFRRIR